MLIGSDLHIQAAIGGNEGHDADKKLEFAMDTIYALDPQLDAFCLVGDITDSGNDKQYQHLMVLLNGSHNTGYNAGNGHTKVILCQGNHEAFTYGVTQARSVFESKTGQQANKVVDINGVPVITMGPIGASDHSYSANYDFFCNALDDLADRNAPIVLLTHHQVQGTSYTSTEWYGDYGEGTGSDIVAVMKQYPNIDTSRRYAATATYRRLSSRPTARIHRYIHQSVAVKRAFQNKWRIIQRFEGNFPRQTRDYPPPDQKCIKNRHSISCSLTASRSPIVSRPLSGLVSCTNLHASKTADYS